MESPSGILFFRHYFFQLRHPVEFHPADSRGIAEFTQIVEGRNQIIGIRKQVLLLRCPVFRQISLRYNQRPLEATIVLLEVRELEQTQRNCHLIRTLPRIFRWSLNQVAQTTRRRRKITDRHFSPRLHLLDAETIFSSKRGGFSKLFDQVCELSAFVECHGQTSESIPFTQGRHRRQPATEELPQSFRM